MKVEQACRFRTNTGYKISARSPGFTAANEKNMEAVFNDSMNALLPRPGDSVVTCTVSGEDAFLAKSTMRTDSMGRKSIFSHTYVINRDFYSDGMAENPGAMLEIPTEDMLQWQPDHDLQTEDLHLGVSGNFDLESLRQKYGLDESRYAQLLYLGTKAICSNSSVCIQIPAKLEPLQTVREFAYCLAAGVMPSLRGKITYSSACDVRQRLCVQAPGSVRIGGQAENFLAFWPNNAVNRWQVDPISQKTFLTIAQATPQERDKILENMDNWLAETVGIVGVNPALVNTAFYYCQTITPGKQNQITAQETLVALNSLSSMMNNPAAVSSALDVSAAILMEKLTKEHLCPKNMLPTLVNYGARTKNEKFQRELGQILGLADTDTRLDAIETLLQPPMTESKDRAVVAMLKNTPAQILLSRQTISDSLIHWCTDENIQDESCIDCCCNLLATQPIQIQKQTICGILDDAEQRKVNLCEEALLGMVLEQLALNAGAGGMGQKYDLQLDLHFPEYTKPTKEQYIQYFFRVRLAAFVGAEEKADMLRDLRTKAPEAFEALICYLNENPDAEKDVQDAYAAQVYLFDVFDREQLREICAQHNQYMDAEGTFEPRCRKIWKQCSEEQFDKIENQFAVDDELDSKERRLMAGTRLEQMLAQLQINTTAVQKFRLSPQTQQRIIQDDAKSFWEKVDFSAIIDKFEEIPTAYADWSRQEYEKKVQEKIRLYDCMKKIENETDTADLCEFMEAYKEEENQRRREINASLLNACIKKFVVSKKIFLWDLLFVSRLMYNKKTQAYTDLDYEGLYKAMQLITKWKPDFDRLIPYDQPMLQYSYMLEQNRVKVKELKKINETVDFPLLNRLLREIDENGSRGRQASFAHGMTPAKPRKILAWNRFVDEVEGETEDDLYAGGMSSAADYSDVGVSRTKKIQREQPLYSIPDANENRGREIRSTNSPLTATKKEELETDRYGATQGEKTVYRAGGETRKKQNGFWDNFFGNKK